MSKKKKTSKDEIMLRREIEALKAQLKEFGIEPSSENRSSSTANLNYTAVKKQPQKSNTSSYENTNAKAIPTDATYLIKDIKKTAIISAVTIVAIVVIKLLKLF